MSEKLFSIITPVYNGEQYIEETIKSVLSQTYRDYEYVIVDSESKDRTIDIINKYKNDVHKVICEKDNGMYDAIDKAIKLSNGKYILWINSDDILNNKKTLENIANLLNKKPSIEWLTGRVSFLYENRKKIFSFLPYIYPKYFIKKGWAHDCAWGFIQQESTVFSKELYFKVGGFNKKLKMAGDFDLWRKFSHETNLYTCNIKIGVQRKWKGQMQQDLKFYYNEINKKRCSFKFLKFIRILFSLIIFPFILTRK